jgi:hypothetical protein
MRLKAGLKQIATQIDVADDMTLLDVQALLEAEVRCHPA